MLLHIIHKPVSYCTCSRYEARHYPPFQVTLSSFFDKVSIMSQHKSLDNAVHRKFNTAKYASYCSGVICDKSLFRAAHFQERANIRVDQGFLIAFLTSNFLYSLLCFASKMEELWFIPNYFIKTDKLHLTYNCFLISQKYYSMFGAIWKLISLFT